MDGYRYGRGQDRDRSFRGRLVLLVLLPTAFLGVTYFLFIEYLLQGMEDPDPGFRMTVRLGGGILVAVSAIFATASGYLLVDRILRPVRVLLRMVQGGEVPDGRRPAPGARCREFSELYRVVGVLLSQNRAGGQALEELEQLRGALAAFREEVGRTGQHGILPRTQAAPEGPLADISGHLQRNRGHLMSFFRDLRERVGGLREEVEKISRMPVFGETGQDSVKHDPPGADGEQGMSPAACPPPVDAPVRKSIERLRRLGTVLTLEAGVASGADGTRVGRLFDSYQAGLDDLEQALEALGRAWEEHAESAASRAAEGFIRAAEEAGNEARQLHYSELRDRWKHLLESLESLDRRLAEAEDR